MVDRYDIGNAVIHDEFDTTWVCPDVDKIYLNNAPFQYDHGVGSSFVLVVNECNQATTVRDAEGQPVGTYAAEDAGCYTVEYNKDHLN